MTIGPTKLAHMSYYTSLLRDMFAQLCDLSRTKKLCLKAIIDLSLNGSRKYPTTWTMLRAHYFVVPKSKDDAAFTILAKIDQDMDFDVGEIWEKFWWSRMNAELLSGMIRSWEYGRPLYTPPRCDKMIAAAGQDFLVKLFQRANQLETEDYLRSETLAKAAKELGLFQYESITASYPDEAKEKKVDL
jgi:hypothetical protein